MADTTHYDAAAFTALGTPRERVTLPAATFDGTVNLPVLHQAVKAYLANQRQGTHATKTRRWVTGGNQKPWKQKGTGRARQGSTRAPNFVGGGTVHGPDRTLTGAAGALLLERLATCTRNFAAILGLCSALTSSSELRNDDLVDQRNVRLHIEDLGGEVNRTRLLAGGIEDVNSCHVSCPSLRSSQPRDRPADPGRNP